MALKNAQTERDSLITFQHTARQAADEARSRLEAWEAEYVPLFSSHCMSSPDVLDTLTGRESRAKLWRRQRMRPGTLRRA